MKCWLINRAMTDHVWLLYVHQSIVWQLEQWRIHLLTYSFEQLAPMTQLSKMQILSVHYNFVYYNVPKSVERERLSVPLFADCGATRRTGGGGGMTSICSRSPLDWTPPFIAGGEGGGGGRVLSRAVYLPSVALFSPGGGGGGGGMFGRCVGVDFLNEPPVSLGDWGTPGAVGFLRMSGGGLGSSPDGGAAFRLSREGDLVGDGVVGCPGFGMTGGGAFSLSTLFFSSSKRTFFGALTVTAAWTWACNKIYFVICWTIPWSSVRVM